MISSQKGDIPVTILVIEVIAICAIAIFSFLISDFNLNQDFYGVASMQEMGLKIDEYNFYKNVGMDENRIDNLLEVEMNSIGNKYLYIQKNKKRWFPVEVLGFGNSENDFLFSVRYNLPS